MPRLNSVLKELNIGFETASLFLKSEFGFDLQSVNDKITEEQEASLVSNFQHDKIQYSVIRKKFASKKNRKNQNPEIPDLDEYEQEVWDTLNEPLKKTHKAKRQARRGSRPVKERTIYVIKRNLKLLASHLVDKRKNSLLPRNSVSGHFLHHPLCLSTTDIHHSHHRT